MSDPAPLPTREQFEARAWEVSEYQLAVLLVGSVAIAAALTVPWVFALAGVSKVKLWFDLSTFGLLGVAALLIVGGMQRAQRRIHELGLVCPECGEELVGGGRSERSRHLRVLTTGRCTQCDARLYPADPAGGKKGVDRVGLLYLAGYFAILLLGLGGSVTLSGLAARKAAERRCLRWLTAAASAEERRWVNQSRPLRRSDETCAGLLAHARSTGKERGP